MKLYQELEGMKLYDHKKFIAKFKGTSIEKYMSSELNYLFEQLLRSLANFHFDSSVQRRLRKSILFLDILIEKGWRKKALKILKQGKKLAHEHEEFTTSLRYIQFEERLVFKEGIVGFADKLDNLKNERQKLYDQIQNLNELRLIREQIREMQFTIQFVTNPKKFKRFYANPLLENEDGALSQKAKQHWYYSRTIRAFLKRDYAEALKESTEYLKHLYKFKHLIARANFLPAISNHLYFSSFMLDKEEFNFAMEKLEDLSVEDDLDPTYIEYIKISRLFEIHYRTNNNVANGKLMKKATHYIQEHYEQMGEAQVNFAALIMTRNCIQLNRFEEGVDWINFWHKVGVMKHSQLPCRLLTMILYFELGWLELLYAENESSYKILKKPGPDQILYLCFHRFYKKYLKALDNREELFLDLCENLKSLKADEEKNFAFVDFDYYKWAINRKKRLGL